MQTMALLSAAPWKVSPFTPSASFRSGVGDDEEQGDSLQVVWALVTRSSVAWQQHAVTGKLQQRK